MSREPKLVRELDRRLAELENQVFNSPPADYSEFRNRQGQWVALTEIKTWVLEQIRKHEEGDEDE